MTSSRESTNSDGFAVFRLFKDEMKPMNYFSIDIDKFSPYINTKIYLKTKRITNKL